MSRGAEERPTDIKGLNVKRLYDDLQYIKHLSVYSCRRCRFGHRNKVSRRIGRLRNNNVGPCRRRDGKNKEALLRGSFARRLKIEILHEAVNVRSLTLLILMTTRLREKRVSELG